MIGIHTTVLRSTQHHQTVVGVGWVLKASGYGFRENGQGCW